MSEQVSFKFAIHQRVLVPTDNGGVVHGLCRKENGDSYLVVWWSEGKRNEDWLHESELREQP